MLTDYTADELGYMSTHRCKHRHTYKEHPSCFEREVRGGSLEGVIEIKKQPEVNIDDLADKVLKRLPPKKRYFPKYDKATNLVPEVWLQLFSDLHFGLVVKAAEVGGLSEYTPEIATERTMYLADTLGRILEYYPNKPDTIAVAFLGDMIDNSILRGNQRANIAMDLVSQIMLTTELLTDFLIELSKYFQFIKVFAVYGNHGRSTKGITDAPPLENFDKLIYWAVQQRIANNKNMFLDFTDAQHMLIEINTWRFWLEHGDTLKGWAGIPYYGAKRERSGISDMMSLIRTQADYLVAAHFHNALFAVDDHILMNGSVVGGDLYSIGRLRRMAVPHQMLYGINEKHGVVWNRPIQLIDNPRNLKVEIHK